MGRLFPLFFLAALALLVVALIDSLSADEWAVRALPRPLWILIILLLPVIGPALWFVGGRPAHSGPPRPRTGVWAPGSGAHEYERPRAPDDDPEFLRDLDAKTRREEEKRLRKWEEDLRRREEELRRRATDPPAEP